MYGKKLCSGGPEKTNGKLTEPADLGGEVGDHEK